MRLFLFFLISATCVTSASADEREEEGFSEPIATTVQLPTFGVSFDADGVLQCVRRTDPTGRLILERLAAARQELPGRLAFRSPNRKVSLVRLHKAIRDRGIRGEDATSVMRHLAGLTQITSVYCYPESGDIVVAGPAEPWITDLRGEAVGIHTGRPTLHLDDFVVALRAYAPTNGRRVFVGCTINPRVEGLGKLQAFQRKIPKVVNDNQRAQVARWVAEGVQESLGMADVRVFGIPATSHFARVMVEADYRMKRIAVGVEIPPVKMATFASSLKASRNGELQRWWFTPNYDGVLSSPDRLAMRLSGQGVQLQTELKEFLPDGSMQGTNQKASKAMETFARSFTLKYGDIAQVDRVYAQLRQMVDYLIVAAYFREFDWYAKAKWDASEFSEDDFYAIEELQNPATAPVVVNVFWKQRRLFAPAGGGVSIVAQDALDKMMDDSDLLRDRAEGQPMKDDRHWWWD